MGYTVGYTLHICQFITGPTKNTYTYGMFRVANEPTEEKEARDSERTHARTGNSCKLHTERSGSESLMIFLYLSIQLSCGLVTSFKVYYGLESPSWKPQIFSFIPAVWAAQKVQEFVRSSTVQSNTIILLFIVLTSQKVPSSHSLNLNTFIQILRTFYFKCMHDSLSTLTGDMKSAISGLQC